MRFKTAGLVGALIAAAVVTGAGSPATAATARIQGQATAPHAAEWKLYKDYASYESCQAKGQSLQDAGIVYAYECEWDSPSWALYVLTH